MIKLNRNSSEEELKSVYDLMVGDVFKVDNNYEGEWETIVQRIFVDYLPQGSIWCATAITPGTELVGTGFWNIQLARPAGAKVIDTDRAARATINWPKLIYVGIGAR